jgi:hypothetical protein
MFVHNYKHPVKVLGIDRSEAIIAECRRRTKLTGLSDVLKYEAGELSEVDFEGSWRAAFGGEVAPQLHGLISLHACDTATDDAIALGLANKAELIAVAPCCQGELSRKWIEMKGAGEKGAFSPLWSIPHLRRTSAATLTDTFRTLLIRAAGYDATALEFVGSEHTPKNTLIRARRRSKDGTEAAAQYIALRAASGGAGIGLERQVPRDLRDLLERLEG